MTSWECRQTSIPGVFACGNVLHVHDLVDYVSEEAEIAGKQAALYIQSQAPSGKVFPVSGKDGVRYAVPQLVHQNAKPFALYFRVGDVYKNVRIVVECEGKVLLSRKKQKAAPGEMETLLLKEEHTAKITGPLTVRLEKEGD